MEVVLHEASTVSKQMSLSLHSVKYGDSAVANGKETESFLESSNEISNGTTFNMPPSDSPVNIKFDNITFTATEGGIFQKKSKIVCNAD